MRRGGRRSHSTGHTACLPPAREPSAHGRGSRRLCSTQILRKTSTPCSGVQPPSTAPATMASTVQRAGSPSTPTKPSAVRTSAAQGHAVRVLCSALAATTIRSRGSLGNAGWTICPAYSLSSRSDADPPCSRTWWYRVVAPMLSSAASRRTVSRSQPSRSISLRAAARISAREVTGGRPMRPGGTEACGTVPAWPRDPDPDAAGSAKANPVVACGSQRIFSEHVHKLSNG